MRQILWIQKLNHKDDGKNERQRSSGNIKESLRDNFEGLYIQERKPKAIRYMLIMMHNAQENNKNIKKTIQSSE